MPAMKLTSRTPAAVGTGSATSRITVTGLFKQFRRADGTVVPAVDGLSLEIGHGEMVVLLGPSGCGKTSLLRCIAGLEQPDEGEVVIDGEVMFSRARKVNRPPNARSISMMFQSYALWPHMTVAKNVAYPLHGSGLSKQQVRERVERILATVGVGELGEQHPAQLSGGQQQRVALARSLVTEPRVILFDEPLSNVDAKVREELRIELMTKQKQLGFTGVYVTHDQVEAMQLADRLVVLEAGRIAQIDAPRAVYTRPRTASVARFVGTMNEVRGRVVEALDGGLVRVTCPLGSVVGRFVAEDGAPEPVEDDEIILGVRAEALHLTGDDGWCPDAANVCAGSLLAEGFAGAYAVRVLMVGDVALDVHTAVGALDDELLTEDVKAWFAVDDTMVFPA